MSVRHDEVMKVPRLHPVRIHGLKKEVGGVLRADQLNVKNCGPWVLRQFAVLNADQSWNAIPLCS